MCLVWLALGARKIPYGSLSPTWRSTTTCLTASTALGRTAPCSPSISPSGTRCLKRWSRAKAWMWSTRITQKPLTSAKLAFSSIGSRTLASWARWVAGWRPFLDPATRHQAVGVDGRLSALRPVSLGIQISRFCANSENVCTVARLHDGDIYKLWTWEVTGGL